MSADPLSVPPALSVCVLACDEEEELARCLDAVAWADEIVVVVDAKSRDGSEKVAREKAHRVEVRRAGYRPVTRRVRVLAGKRVRVVVELDPQ